MKKFGMIAAIFTFAAAAIGLIIALIYFLDRKMGIFSGDEEIENIDCIGEEYYAEDLSFESAPEEAAPAAAETAEEAKPEVQE